jgi:hypothetical protein
MVYKGSFEDILFVLSGLVWVGYSLYRANKKKDQKSKSTHENRSSGSNSLFDELLSQFANEGEQKETIVYENDLDVATPVSKLESNVDSNQPYSYDDIYEEDGRNKTLFAEPTVQDEVKKENDNSAYRLDKQVHKNKSFDLKSAFIYSEILKQKYI